MPALLALVVHKKNRMSDIAIRVEGIGKTYKIGRKKSGELRETFSHFWNKFKPITKNQPTKTDNQDFWALKDINFEVKQGEAVGIIGRNGAGKSTLLKVLSRITKPTTGRFEINGRVSSLLEVGTGFHPELTGRENIYLNGTILGMRRAEIKSKFDEIIDFSGVEEFLDTPVKHYSSGMKVRLAFSVAAHLEPEILIIDEVLAVGDAEFQKKCLGKMEDVTGEGRTVLFVSHNMGAIKSLCQNGIVINSGLIRHIGSIENSIKFYLKDLLHSSNHTISGNNSVFLKKFELFTRINDQQYTESNNFNSYDELNIKLEYFSKEEIRDVTIAICFNNVNNTRVTSLWNNYFGHSIKFQQGCNQIQFNVPKIHLIPGEYEIILYAESKGKVLERIDGFRQITVGTPSNLDFVKIPEISQGVYLENFTVKMV